MIYENNDISKLIEDSLSPKLTNKNNARWVECPNNHNLVFVLKNDVWYHCDEKTIVDTTKPIYCNECFEHNEWELNKKIRRDKL